MAITSTIEAFLPAFLAAGALAGISLGWWLIRFPRLAVYLLIVSLLTGQLIRYALPGQGGGLLLSDIAVSFVLLVVGVYVFRDLREKKQDKSIEVSQLLLLLITPFMIWSLVGLLLSSSALGLSGLLVAFSYWIRLSFILLLLPGLTWLFSKRKDLRKSVLNGMFALVLAISVLGFVQLWLLPDLSIFTDMGWDPHQRRLVSTWMDPNLLAGLLVTTLPFMIVVFLSKKRRSVAMVLAIVLPLAALLLTQSRSGLVALFAMILILAPLWLVRWLKTSPKAKVVAVSSLFGIAVLIGGIGVFLLGDRAIGLLRSDATVQLRAAALTKTWSMAEDSSFFGTGYNAYQFAALEAGLIGDFNIHSRGGADNSWLTLWVTTGIIGIVLWLLPWLFLLHLFLVRWFREGHLLSFAAVAGFTALFIHSQFVNSFLYGHLLIALIIIFAFSTSNRLVSK